MKTRLLLPLAILFAAALAIAQQPPLADSGTARAEYISPFVHSDRTVEFHIPAPGATDVKVHFANKDFPMKKGADGWWNATIGPFDPEIYTYNYIVDGANVLALIDGAGLDNSQVEIPGNPPRCDEVQNVPHGTITLHEYYSNVQGRTRHFRVYLPPQYLSEPNQKFPVFYLFNGFDDIQWTTIGKVNEVLDNLIAQKKAVPMIIVMPFNRIHGETVAQVAATSANAKTPEERAGLSSSLDTIAVFEKELPNEIMPIVEKDYRTYTDRDHRAIAGLSMGGGQTLAIGFRHLDLFSAIGAFSAAIPGDFEKEFGETISNPKDVNAKLKVLWFACGKQDSLFERSQKFSDLLDTHQIKHTFRPSEGAHVYKVWRLYLSEFAPLLFR